MQKFELKLKGNAIKYNLTHVVVLANSHEEARRLVTSSYIHCNNKKDFASSDKTTSNVLTNKYKGQLNYPHIIMHNVKGQLLYGQKVAEKTSEVINP